MYAHCLLWLFQLLNFPKVFYADHVYPQLLMGCQWRSVNQRWGCHFQYYYVLLSLVVEYWPILIVVKIIYIATCHLCNSTVIMIHNIITKSRYVYISLYLNNYVNCLLFSSELPNKSIGKTLIAIKESSIKYLEYFLVQNLTLQ